MLVSFVNAGLVSLTESIGVIMGANIGTTVTAWLISILGFKVEITQLVLPLMGLALPLIFSSNRKRSNWGGVIIGFAMIFIGLDFLKNAVPDINSNPELMVFLTKFSNHGYLSLIIYLMIGALITMIIQSSSAVMALTLVMCYNGWISFEMAAALVLGQNIGTTITANLAALIANTSAKRAARAHLLFNVIGVIIVLIAFKPFLNLIDWITIKTGSISPYHSRGHTSKEIAEAIPIALSIFHTVFNLLNTFLLIWFVPQIIRIVVWMVPHKEDDEEFRLQYISTGLLSTNELSILQAKKETILYARRIRKMFEIVKQLLLKTSPKKTEKMLNKIMKYEEISDQMEVEIASYLTKIAEDSLSDSGSEAINRILYVISHIESIGDSCHSIARAIERQVDQHSELTPDMVKNFGSLIELCVLQLDEMTKNLEAENRQSFTETYLQVNEKLTKLLQKLQTEHFKSLKKGSYKCKDGIIYADIYLELGNIGKYAFEINEQLVGVVPEPEKVLV